MQIDTPTLVLAHNGGWDELLLVAGPILALGALLWMANRRAERLKDSESDTS